MYLFTYVGIETKLITKIFKDINVKITFTTDNTIENHLATRQKQNKYEKCNMYQLTCPSCNMKHLGQTGRPFKVHFQEHLRGFKYGSKKSKFAQHLLENKHHIGPMEIII